MTENTGLKDLSSWEQDFIITHYFVDPDGYTSIHGIAFFLQEVAHNHASARSLGFEDLIRENKAWVLTRQVIKLYRIPVIGDQISVHSWVSETTPAFSVRDFHLLDDHQKVIGLARTSWMMIDIIHRKPVRIPDKVLSFIPLTPGKLTENLGLDKLPSISEKKDNTGFEVKYSDLDMNNHVNNITYARWVTDDFDLEFRKKFRLEMLEMNYLGEALYGDSLVANTVSTGSENSYQTTIWRSEDKRDILNARTFWKAKS
jgi:medium-chain acyl-[acyl-carrier-protein] hydrolase